MIHPRKPVWTEGLFMTPQHLQQSDQYHEALLHSRMHAIATYDWGVTGVNFDERALAAGQLKLVKCHGFFPDGTPFFIGDRGVDVIEARPLEGVFPASIDMLDVFLAVPNARETASNIALDPAKAGPAVRFVASSVTVPDVNTGRNETAVTWARENLRILFGTEARDAFQSIRIGQLQRDRTGQIIVRKSFIPSVLHIGASEHLMASMRRVLSALVGKQKSLAEGRRLRSAANVDFQASDTAKFWLLHTCNSFIPVTSHFVDHGDASPEELYMMLGGLIGQLCTFSADGDPTGIPKFNYLDLTECFEPIFARVMALIAGSLADDYIVVPMEKREDGMYLGRFEDPKIPRNHELFLEAKGIDEATLRERLPRLLKIGSWTHIGHILNAAMPGVRVQIEYRPPGAIPIRPGVVYLRVDQSGDYWNDILGSGTIAIYQPIEPQKVDLRLIGVKAAGSK
jgi:type VI secretion system protein ImpJ